MLKKFSTVRKAGSAYLRKRLARGVHGALLVSLLGLGGCGSIPEEALKLPEELLREGAGSALLSSSEITDGLKEALLVGSDHVVRQLGASGGFSADNLIRIELPESFQKVRNLAAQVGMDDSFNELEQKMNRAAELATPRAKRLFVDAIKDMSVSDGRKILNGPDDAATQYFRGKTGDKLAAQMQPVVRQALSDSGVYQYYRKLEKAWSLVPGAKSLDADLEGHVVDKGMDGIFHYLAEEEKAIREDPLKRTTELLRKVFAAQ